MTIRILYFFFLLQDLPPMADKSTCTSINMSKNSNLVASNTVSSMSPGNSNDVMAQSQTATSHDFSAADKVSPAQFTVVLFLIFN